MSVNWEEERQKSFRQLAKTGRLYELYVIAGSQDKLYHLLAGTGKQHTGSFGALLTQSKGIYESRVDEEILPAELPDKEIITPERKIEAYKHQNIQLRSENERLKEFYSQFQDLLVGVLEPMPPLKAPKRTEKGKVDHAAIMTIADIHGGEWVKGDETADLSEYNYEIFLKRRDRLLDAFTNQIADFRRTYKLNTLYILGLGDFVTGEDVFNMQQARIDLLLGEQILTMSQEMARTILAMAEQFSHTEVILQFGNHGKERNTTNNNDVTAYQMIKMLLSKQENMNIRISPTTFDLFSIGPKAGHVDFGDEKKIYNYLVFHGQEAKRYMGMPWYGIYRAKMRFDQMVKTVSDMMFIGHHHTDAYVPDEGWTATASWLGGTQYSISTMQAAGRPSQHLYYFTPKHGIGMNIQLFLDDEPKLAEPDKDGVRIEGMKIPTLEDLETE